MKSLFYANASWIPWGYNGFTTQLHWSTSINPPEILGGTLRMQAKREAKPTLQSRVKQCKTMWWAQFHVHKTSQPCMDPISPNPAAAHGQPRKGAALHQTQRLPARAKSNISNCWKRKHEVQKITWGSLSQIEAVPKEDLKNVYESLPSVFHHVFHHVSKRLLYQGEAERVCSQSQQQWPQL